MRVAFLEPPPVTERNPERFAGCTFEVYHFPDLGNLVAMYPEDECTTVLQSWTVARKQAPPGVDYEKYDAEMTRSLGLTDRIMAEDLFISEEIGANRDSFAYTRNIFNTLECRLTAFHQEIEKYLA